MLGLSGCRDVLWELEAGLGSGEGHASWGQGGGEVFLFTAQPGFCLHFHFFTMLIYYLFQINIYSNQEENKMSKNSSEA